MILRPLTFDFCEKKGFTPPFFKKDATFCPSHVFVICIFFFLLKRHNFFSFTSFYLSTQLSARLSAQLSARLSTSVIRPSYPPGLSARVIWGYSSSYLMLSNLTNHFNKLSNGDLQCEWNSDFFFGFLVVTVIFPFSLDRSIYEMTTNNNESKIVQVIHTSMNFCLNILEEKIWKFEIKTICLALSSPNIFSKIFLEI